MDFLQGLVLFSAVFFGVGIPLVSMFYTKVGRVILINVVGILAFFLFLSLSHH